MVVSALNNSVRSILAELYGCFCSGNSLIDSLLMCDWLVFSSLPPHATAYFGRGHQQMELEQLGRQEAFRNSLILMVVYRNHVPGLRL
jgi:hypothetical protein